MDKILPNSIREEILREITPTQEEIELQQTIITTLTQALIAYSKENDFEYSFIEPQGSTGRKQTQLKGAGDIDLFVALDPERYEQTLELPIRERNAKLDTMLDAIVDDWFIPAFSQIKTKFMLKTYSQHPYLSMNYLESDVDVLVCFDLSRDELADNGPVTAVDRTVHHTRFIADNLDKKLREDIRILKSFVKACHTYGDICPVGQMGFTGYSLELLVLLQNGLYNALSALRNLDQQPIDIEQRSLETLSQNPAFRDNHVFIIDPTDTNRNVASSFSKRAYDWLKLMTIRLLEVHDSDIEVFRNLIIERPLPADPLPPWLAPHTFAYTFKSDGMYHYTILRDKLYRFARRIVSQLEKERTGECRFGNVLFEVCSDNNQFALGFIVENVKISETYSRRGPPVGIEGSTRFAEAHEEVYEKEGHLWINEKREWIDAESLLENLIGKHYIKGLTLKERNTELANQVCNVLFRYVLPIEPAFPLKGTV